MSVTRENRKDIDRIIHRIVRTRYKNCPATWRKVKKRIAEDEEGFISELKRAMVQGL